ncbi:unnamed protein product [Oikopleura dioica]|uniref:Major facilitator superfamily (MFS) profile domain-containing protein n=1 Tax=Oikopleura dioica TaxID=34765 RepID=E4X1R0_OIKDI|nr:unnamed protein product [Oikopleura dioica]
MERLLEETWGTGKCQKTALILSVIPIFTLQALFVPQLLYGQILPHTCAENNTILERYSVTNYSSCEGFACSMDTSFANDWGLLCDRETERNQLPSYFMLSSSIGTLCSGVIFDKFGRRNGTMFYYISAMVVYAVMAFAPDFAIFKICYSCLGFLTCGIGSYTLMMEMSKSSWKWVVGTTCTISWTIGNLWMILCTYFVRDWRLALKLTSLPLLSTLALPFFLPESPRWLIKNGKKDEAVHWIKHISARNGVEIDDKYIMSSIAPMLKHQESETAKLNENLWDFLQAKSLMIRFVILCLISFSLNILWMNIIMAADKMHCCIYITYAVFIILEGPLRGSYTGVLTRKVRRKGIYFFSGFSAIFFLLMLALTKFDEEDEYAILKLGLGAIAKLCCTSYFVFMFTLTVEVLPTNFRQRGLTILISAEVKQL